MRKLIFTSFVVVYGLIASVVMLPLSIFNGLFGLFIHFWGQLIAGIKDYHKDFDQEKQKETKGFSWEDYALERDKANAEAKEDK
jgi:hypothetical protein